MCETLEFTTRIRPPLWCLIAASLLSSACAHSHGAVATSYCSLSRGVQVIVVEDSASAEVARFLGNVKLTVIVSGVGVVARVSTSPEGLACLRYSGPPTPRTLVVAEKDGYYVAAREYGGPGLYRLYMVPITQALDDGQPEARSIAPVNGSSENDRLMASCYPARPAVEQGEPARFAPPKSPSAQLPLAGAVSSSVGR
jgi:hypothetical protein